MPADKCYSRITTHGPQPQTRKIPIRLYGPDANVTLDIDSIPEQLGGHLKSRYLDYMEICAVVFVTDQCGYRGDGGARRFGQDWQREIECNIPVRDLEFWSSSSAIEALVDVLNFMTQDRWTFKFSKIVAPPLVEHYFVFKPREPESNIREVALFSGGIDSLAGAVDACITRRRNTAFVCHDSAPILRPPRNRLRKQLKEASDTPGYHLDVKITKHKLKARDYTQRTRSFLFCGLAASVASILDVDTIRFYENGIVSINLAPLYQITGSKASRTTHPRTLSGLQRLVSLIAQRPVSVENPFLWKTRAELVKLIVDQGCGDMLRNSISCTHPREISRDVPHCGRCVQCIGRRIAMIAAGAHDLEPVGSYKFDLFADEFPNDETRVLALGIVEWCSRVSTLSPVDFFAEHGELFRVVQDSHEEFELVMSRLFDLHRRYANEVDHVIEVKGIEMMSRMLVRSLPPNSLFPAITATPGQASTNPVQAGPPPTQPTLGDNIFLPVGRGMFRIRFNGGPEHVLQLGLGGKYLHMILDAGDAELCAVDVVELSARERQEYQALSHESIDGESLADLRKRAEDLVEEIARAKKKQSTVEAELFERELQEVAEQIDRSTSPDGKPKKIGGFRDKVAKRVNHAISRAIKKISNEMPDLGNHLNSSIRAWHVLRYSANVNLQWSTDLASEARLHTSRGVLHT